MGIKNNDLMFDAKRGSTTQLELEGEKSEYSRKKIFRRREAKKNTRGEPFW